jgi:hypothetical protein
MRNVRTKVYKFNELNETAKQTAINNFLASNFDSTAFDDILEDAKQIGLIIQSIDDHRPNKGSFKDSALECSAKICQEHGKECETYKTAESFSFDYDKLVEKYSDGVDLYKVSYENEYEFDQEADELETDFLHSLLEDYRILYNKQIGFESSDEFVTQEIEANSYEFLKDGSIYRA